MRRCPAASDSPRMAVARSQDGAASAVLAVGQRVRDPGVDDQHGQAVRRPGRTGCSRRCPPGCRTAAPTRVASAADAVWSIGPQGTPTKSFSACWASRAISSGVEVDAGQRRHRQRGHAFHRGRRGQAGPGRHLGVQREVEPADGMAGLAQRPDGADQVARPRLRDRGEPGRMSSRATVVTAPGRCAETTRTTPFVVRRRRPGWPGRRWRTAAPGRRCSRCARRSG